jgi:hypothetical protein|nr:MAG TPA: hypothetical protein [Caudoviricetes sp.]
MEYGYIENGYLRSRRIESEAVVASLSQEWKPVDKIDEQKLQCEEGYIVKIVPYDAGDHISFRYEKKQDLQQIRQNIENLKNELKDGDYKVIKCYEASLTKQEMPYNIQELHSQRQLLRQKINELEEKMTDAQRH